VLDAFVSHVAYPSLDRRVELAGVVSLLGDSAIADGLLQDRKVREALSYHVRQLMHIYASSPTVARAGLMAEVQTKQCFQRHAPAPAPLVADLRIVDVVLRTSSLLGSLQAQGSASVRAVFTDATPAMQFALWLVDIGRVLELARGREAPIVEMTDSGAGLCILASSSAVAGDDVQRVSDEQLLRRFDELINSNERPEPTASIGAAAGGSPDRLLYYRRGPSGSLKPLSLQTLAAFVYLKFRDSMPLGFSTLGQHGVISRLQWSRAFGSLSTHESKHDSDEVDGNVDMKENEESSNRNNGKQVKDVKETDPFLSTARIPTASTNALLKNGERVRLFCYAVRYLRDVIGCKSVWFSEDAAYCRVQEDLASARSFAYFCAIVQRTVLSVRELKPALLLMHDPVICRFLKDARDSVGQVHTDPAWTPSLVPGGVSEFAWTVGVEARSTGIHYPPMLADPTLNHFWVLLPSLVREEGAAGADGEAAEEKKPSMLSFPLRINPRMRREKEMRNRREAAEPSHLGVAAESLVSDADKLKEQAARSEAVIRKCCAETKRELLNWAAQEYLALEVNVEVCYPGDLDMPQIVIRVRGPADVLSHLRLDAKWGTTWQQSNGGSRISDALGELICVGSKPVVANRDGPKRAATCHDFTADQYNLVRHLLDGWNTLIVTGGVVAPPQQQQQSHPSAAAVPYQSELPQSMRRDARDHPLRTFAKVKQSERLLPEDLVLLARQTEWMLAQLPGRVQSGARFSGMRWQDVARWVPSSVAFYDLLVRSSELQANLHWWTTFVRNEAKQPPHSVGDIMRQGGDSILDPLRESVAAWPIEITRDGTCELFQLLQPLFGFVHQFLRLHPGWEGKTDAVDVKACERRAQQLTRLQPLNPAWNDTWNTHKPALHIHMALQKASVTEKLTNLNGFDFHPQAEKEDFAAYCARFRDSVRRSQSDVSKGALVKSLGNSFRFLWSNLSRGAAESMHVGKLDPFEALFVRGLYDERLYMAGVRWLAWKTEHPDEVDDKRSAADAAISEVQIFAEELPKELQEQHLAVCSLSAPLTQALVNEYNAALGSPTMRGAITLDMDQLVIEEFTQVIGVATANDTRLEVRVRGAGTINSSMKVHIPHSTVQRWLQPECPDHYRMAFIRPLLVAFGHKLRSSAHVEARDCLDRIDSLLRRAESLEGLSSSSSPAFLLPAAAADMGSNGALFTPSSAAPASESTASSGAPSTSPSEPLLDGPQPVEMDEATPLVLANAAPAAAAVAPAPEHVASLVVTMESSVTAAAASAPVNPESLATVAAASAPVDPSSATAAAASAPVNPESSATVAASSAPVDPENVVMSEEAAEVVPPAAAAAAATEVPIAQSQGNAQPFTIQPPVTTAPGSVPTYSNALPLPIPDNEDEFSLSQSATQPVLDVAASSIPETPVASVAALTIEDVNMTPAAETVAAGAAPAAVVAAAVPALAIQEPAAVIPAIAAPQAVANAQPEDETVMEDF
jgi:hypothetical protein